jgi:hypothetical protein
MFDVVEKIHYCNRNPSMLGESLVTTAHPQVADGVNGFQLWRVAADTLNKQLRATDKWWFFNFWVGCGANNPSVTNKHVTNSL